MATLRQYDYLNQYYCPTVTNNGKSYQTCLRRKQMPTGWVGPAAEQYECYDEQTNAVSTPTVWNPVYSNGTLPPTQPQAPRCQPKNNCKWIWYGVVFLLGLLVVALLLMWLQSSNAKKNLSLQTTTSTTTGTALNPTVLSTVTPTTTGTGVITAVGAMNAAKTASTAGTTTASNILKNPHSTVWVNSATSNLPIESTLSTWRNNFANVGPSLTTNYPLATGFTPLEQFESFYPPQPVASNVFI